MRLLSAIFTALLLSSSWAAENPSGTIGQPLKGVVIESRDVDAYTYLHLNTADGKIWAAVNKSAVQNNSEVTIVNTMVLKDFESKSLKKKFETIVFGTLADGASDAAGGNLRQIHQGIASETSAVEVKVPKATGPNAKTVAEINERKAALKGQTVLVRGKVVKFTPNVMGKNWIHLRDGSGSANKNTNDILVTSKDQTRIGETVLARGTVRTNVDLGSGYNYQVLIESASLQN